MRTYGLLIMLCLPAAAARAQTGPEIHGDWLLASKIVPGLVVLTLCSAAVAIVWLVSRHRQEQATLMHKTAIELTQRNLPLPPQLFASAGVSRLYSDLRTGLVLMGLGVGAIVFALTLPKHPAWGLGLIPLFAGLGYILTWLLGKPPQQSPSDHP